MLWIRQDSFSDVITSHLSYNDENNIISGNKVTFPSQPTRSTRYAELLYITPLDPQQTISHFYARYVLEGSFDCANLPLFYSVGASISLDGCKKTNAACNLLESLPNEQSCFVECDCQPGECSGVFMVRKIANFAQWTLQKPELA